jgi:DNA primase
MADLSPATIELVRNTADIVDVISDFVRLQPAGKNYKGLCPFHQEKTPSFTVSKERQYFHCFGCGEKGNTFQFLQKIKNISFPEAVKALADRYQIPLELKSGSGYSNDFERLYQANQSAQEFFALSLTNLESGRPALAYLAKRGLPMAMVQQFQIGFAPDKFDGLYQVLKERHSEIDLLEIGLIRKTETGYVDLFRNRVIFPVTNEQGKVVGFSGRIYMESNRPEPKYVNSPFTKLFVKGDILYNLFNALTPIRQKNRVFLYEGFMDVIASFRAGITEAVASMGTALTPSQAKLIRKYTENVVLCYDGDKAGFEAMNKAIHLLEEAHLTVSLLLLPESLDPDEYLQKYGMEALRNILESTQIDPWEFRYQYLKRKADFSKIGAIERFKTEFFRELLEKASDTVIAIYLRKMAEDLRIDSDSLRNDLRHMQLAMAINTSKKGERATPSPTQNILVVNRGVKAEIALLNYYIENYTYREHIGRELSKHFCVDKINMEILVNVQELLDHNINESLREQVVSKYSAVRQAEVKKRLQAHPEPYQMAELDDLIFTIKVSDLERQIQAIEEQSQEVDKLLEMNRFLGLQMQKNLLMNRKDTLWKNRKS